MLRNRCRMTLVVLGTLGLGLLLTAGQAQAVPSFARQVGMDCSACHTIFPELTPFGRNFKLTGYTISKKSDKPYEFPPPLSAHMILSFTNIKKSLPPNISFGLAPQQDVRGNDNLGVPQEVSLFYGGRILPYVGAFVQGTYDGIATTFALDHTDVRFAYPAKLADKSLVLGLTMNNAPTVSDILNTTAFGFPWTSSAVNLTPSAATVLDGGLDSMVGGLGTYFYWNNLLYGEAAVYRTASNGVAQFLGAGTITDTLVENVAPYWRVFLQHQWQQHSLAVGTFGLITQIFPADQNRGTTDRFADIALDAQYQFIGKKHLFTAQTIWIHEAQRRDASLAQKASSNNRDWLDTYKINLNYYYRTANWGTFGGTVAYFDTWGSKDKLLYVTGTPGDNSRTGKPNSNGFILEGSYSPLKYTKITIQYTIFNRFNGSGSNYDGFGRNASDNNTLFLAIWSAI